MHQSGQSDAVNRNSSVRAGVCLFLAVLFFYNPFFTIYGSASGLSARHPLSFRGTVASSELRCGVIPQAKPQMAAPEEIVLETMRRPEVLPLDAAVPESVPPRIGPQTHSASLWFRPPPSI
jgi:hypothetical protein